MKKGNKIQVTIDDVTFGAEGIGRLDGKVVFVEKTLPGEEVVARITQKRRDYVRAQVIDFIKESPEREKAPCNHFGPCGGCKWQDVQYAYQLELKRHIVAETLRRIGGFSEIQIFPTLLSPDIFFYRNKMEYSFSAQRWILAEETDPLQKPKDFALGLHVPGRFDKVLDIDACWLQSETANRLLQLVKDFSRKSGKPAWNTRNHTGFWRYLAIREGKKTGQMMVNVITAEHNQRLMADLTQRLRQEFPDLTSIVNNVTKSPGGSAFGEKEYLLSGSSTIEEKIGDFVFEISANSFFQTNSNQAERLYETIVDFTECSADAILFDLYAGAGTISIFVSPFMKKVVGFEVIESAVKDAQRNLLHNQVTNCEMVLGDIRDQLRHAADLMMKYGNPDIVVLDPPRAGIHPKSIAGIVQLQANKIIYVSCNPSTFARDARMLCDAGYRLRRVKPVDMFPHAYHIELVGDLVKL